jgi:hypothetical protein
MLSVDVGADDAGRVTVDITAIIDDELLDSLRGMSVEVSNVFREYNSLRAIASLEQLETIASFGQVRFIQPKQEALFSQTRLARRKPAAAQTRYSSQTGLPAWGRRYSDFNNRTARVRTVLQPALGNAPVPNGPLGVGSVTSQGDTTHKAFTARGTFNTDGTGIKIGVLSDGVSSLAISQATGDLGTVTILPGQEGFGDEGTAMLEIIHDLAPGAQLYFATAVPAPESRSVPGASISIALLVSAVLIWSCVKAGLADFNKAAIAAACGAAAATWHTRRVEWF